MELHCVQCLIGFVRRLGLLLCHLCGVGTLAMRAAEKPVIAARATGALFRLQQLQMVARLPALGAAACAYDRWQRGVSP